jgi:hypothetical protein
MISAKSEFGKSDNRLEDKQANLYLDDENLLLSPDHKDFENQDSKNSLLSSPSGNTSGFQSILDRSHLQTGQKDNVKVVIRVRPLNERELSKSFPLYLLLIIMCRPGPES